MPGPPCIQALAITGRLWGRCRCNLWSACDEGDGTHVIAIRDGVVMSRQRSPPFYVAYRDPQGTIWFAALEVLAHLDTPQCVCGIPEGRSILDPLRKKRRDAGIEVCLVSRSLHGAFCLGRSSTLRKFSITMSTRFRAAASRSCARRPRGTLGQRRSLPLYGADATAAIPPGESGTLIRLRAGPSSNALAVNRVEICFDMR